MGTTGLYMGDDADEVLAEYGLERGDFVRFREVETRSDGTIRVCTREGGVNGVSAKALSNPTYVRSETDWGDQTYQYHFFATDPTDSE